MTDPHATVTASQHGGFYMEPVLLIGGAILIYGVVWTVQDLLEESGLLTEADRKVLAKKASQACSGLRSRDISSRTACRAGLSAYRIS